ncbi:MAG: hypothetical protein H0T56_04395 [Pseudaminobacter sp.]|nr:hypothetical protein [Pseudaminobacter sp.]
MKAKAALRRRDDDPSDFVDLLDRLAVYAGVLVDTDFFPAGPRLQPENRCGDGFPSVAGSLPIKVLGHLRIGLGVAEVQFMAIVLPERFRIDADHARDFGFGNAIAGQRLDLPALHLVRLVARAGHVSSRRFGCDAMLSPGQTRLAGNRPCTRMIWRSRGSG